MWLRKLNRADVEKLHAAWVATGWTINKLAVEIGKGYRPTKAFCVEKRVTVKIGILIAIALVGARVEQADIR